MKRLLRVLFAAGVATISISAGPPSKVAPDISLSNPNTQVDVIIRYKGTPTKADLKQLGPYGQIKKEYSIISGIRITLSVSTIQEVAQNGHVAYISPNRRTKAHLDIPTGAVNANLVWSYGYDGTGVGVAVIDSGVAPVADLGSRVVYSESEISGVGTSDDFGHGTHVAGIVGANGAASQVLGSIRTYKGVAPNANIISLKVLDQNGAGLESDVITAIERAVALKNTYNIRVINLSLGRPVFESFTLDPLCQAVEAAWKAGIVVVVAAGNNGRDNTYGENGYGTIDAPGNDPYVITVGATNTHGTTTIADDVMASYSSKGPTAIDHIVKPDLVAPGNKVVSLLASPTCTLATLYPTLLMPLSTYVPGAIGNSNNYFSLSGTSMATPVVSGAAALLIQKNPALTPDDVKARMMKTAAKALPPYMSTVALDGTSYTFQGDIFTVGAGYLDIFAALQNGDVVPTGGVAVSPAVQYNATTGQVSLVRTLSLIWGSGLIWGDDLIWGDGLIWGDDLIWGDTVLPGGVNGSSLVWGDSLSVVWGNHTASAFSLIWGDTVNLAAQPVASAANNGDKF